MIKDSERRKRMDCRHGSHNYLEQERPLHDDEFRGSKRRLPLLLTFPLLSILAAFVLVETFVPTIFHCPASVDLFLKKILYLQGLASSSFLSRLQHIPTGGDTATSLSSGAETRENQHGDEDDGEAQNSNSSTFFSNSTYSKVLNVHVVPHTHDDVGWLKTVDQYFWGRNMSIQHACVNDIIDTVVRALEENPNRKFTYVEQKFFSMWWYQQNSEMKESVRALVKNNQLNFVNGGWCMHDEASTHYMGMIDQTTLGHTFLKEELSVIPKVGWQLDPFGHSATQASVMTSKMGFNSLFFGRIDYQDLQLRQLSQECEGLWDANQSMQNDDTTIFWGLTGEYRGNYGPPSNFCFDIHCDDPQLISMNTTTLMKSMNDFLQKIRIQSDQTKGNNIMLTMGSDFQYMQARVNFANLDTLIETITDLQKWKRIDIPAMFGPRFDKINIFYSSPEIYTQSKYDELMLHRKTDKNKATNYVHPAMKKDAINYSVKKDDFFPYSDCQHCFWTGYFTSRAAFKRLERVASSFLFAARQVESLLDYTGESDPLRCSEPMHTLEDASGVVQHHDGVSGTAKQHVANDYAKRLQGGIDDVSTCMKRKVKRLLLGENASRYLTDLSYCQLLNETVCDVSQWATDSLSGRDVYAIVYNSLSRERSLIVNLPVSKDGLYRVEQLGVSNSRAAKIVQSHPSSQINNQSAPFVVSFLAGPLLGLGASIHKVSLASNSTIENEILVKSQDRSPVNTKITRSIETSNDDVEASNGLFSVVFDGTTGCIKKMKTNGTELDLKQTWGYYTSFNLKYDRVDPNDHTSASTQNSGAYIFRPSTPDQKLIHLKAVSASFVNTSVGMEVNVIYNEPWIQTKTRVLEGQAFLDIEYTVGPIPIGDQRGKEVLTRFESSVSSSSTFYTDSNGREFMKRIRNYRPTWKLNTYEPVAGNYYPVNAAIYIEDDKGKALSVVTDRTQGGSSLVDGSIEMMVHRRTLADDSRGVGEPMNETDGGITPCHPFGNATRIGKGLVVRGNHRISIGSNGGATLARSMMDSMFAEPVVLVGSAATGVELPLVASNFSGVLRELPSNVMLLTRRVLYSEPDPTFLVRVGHQYGIGEDPKLAEAVEIDLNWLFPGYEIQNVTEMTLSGNRAYEQWRKNRFNWVDPGAQHFEASIAPQGTTVKISPMDIRTFHVKTKAISKA